MREEYVVATKVHGRTMPGRTGRDSHASTSSPRSTRRSSGCYLDYVDLYEIHRWDPLTPVEETMEALHDVVRAGKARYIGASSMLGLAVREGASESRRSDSSRCRTTTTSSTARRSGR